MVNTWWKVHNSTCKRGHNGVKSTLKTLKRWVEFVDDNIKYQRRIPIETIFTLDAYFVNLI